MQLLKYLVCLPVTCYWLVQALDVGLLGDTLATKLQPPKSNDVDAECDRFFRSDPDPAKVWKTEFAATELKRFETAWAKDARFCDACRGLTKAECEKQLGFDSPDLRDACRRGIREAAENRWVMGAYRWLMEEAQHAEVCEIGEDCFHLPDCRQTKGPAAFIILKSLHHLSRHNQIIQDAAESARLSVLGRNSDLYRHIVLQVAEHDDAKHEWFNLAATFASTMMFSFLPLKFNELAGPPIGTFYVYTVTIPGIVKLAKQEKRKSLQGKVPQERILNEDLNILANGARDMFKNATDELFGTGRMRSAKLSMADIIKGGSYYGPRDYKNEKIRESFEQHMTRGIALSAYKRQGFKLFWVSTLSDSWDLPEFMSFKDPNSKTHSKLMEMRCHHEYHIREWYERPHWPHDQPHSMKHCPEEPDWTASALSRGDKHYQPMFALDDDNKCNVAQVPGASRRVFNDTSTFGRLTLEQFLGPVLNAALGLGVRGNDGMPAESKDLIDGTRIFNNPDQVPHWPLCESYTNWARSDTKAPIQNGCWNLNFEGCPIVNSAPI